MTAQLPEAPQVRVFKKGTRFGGLEDPLFFGGGGGRSVAGAGTGDCSQRHLKKGVSKWPDLGGATGKEQGDGCKWGGGDKGHCSDDTGDCLAYRRSSGRLPGARGVKRDWKAGRWGGDRVIVRYRSLLNCREPLVHVVWV